MIEDPVCVAPTGDVCGEGAIWHAAHDAVYWIEINRFLIHRLDLLRSDVRTRLSMSRSQFNQQDAEQRLCRASD